jgi:hypothetical protein
MHLVPIHTGKNMKENNNGSATALLERKKIGDNLVSKRAKKIKRYALKLVGVSALLTDPMNAETLNSLRTGEKLQIDKNRSLDEICECKLYRDEDGELTIPAANVLAALNHVGGFFSYPGTKKNLATGATSLIPSFLRIEGEYLKLSHDGWKPDQRRGRLATGVAVAIVRPKFKTWSIELVIQLDDNEPIKIETVLALFEKAGKASGLGSFRPSCKGAFGQFDVESCYEIELEK